MKTALRILQREMKKKKIRLYLDKTVEKTEVVDGRVKVTSDLLLSDSRQGKR